MDQIWSQIEKLSFLEIWDVPWRISIWPLYGHYSPRDLQVVMNPRSMSGDPGSVARENTRFKRGCGVAPVRPCDSTVPKVGKAWESFLYPNSLISGLKKS